MSLPRFFDRVADAALPLLELRGREALAERLRKLSVRLKAAHAVGDDPNLRAGFMMAANLAARLYPTILLDGSRDIVAAATTLIRAINPLAQVEHDGGAPTDGELGWDAGEPSRSRVVVGASGWTALIDHSDMASSDPAGPACIAAAAIGMGELFRAVFADELGGRGRTAPQPGAFNLVTGEPHPGDVRPSAAAIDLGHLILVGGGAVGQAAVAALQTTDVSGRLTVVDPEKIDSSNLQRYVLAMDADEGAVKTALVARALRGRLQVDEKATEWNACADLAAQGSAVLCGVDSAEARIAIQAGLPARIYNAWTQPQDLGWSRHERFGTEPCLACLYWPTGPRPSRHQLIAAALGIHPLRALGYLVDNVAVGMPLSSIQVPAGEQRPPEADLWSRVPVLDDVSSSLGVPRADMQRWVERSIDDLYREGVCGGILLAGVDRRPHARTMVPLAHQSVLAGVMLAVQVIAASDSVLRQQRSTTAEGRFDVLRGLPQETRSPRALTPGCICSDADFVGVYARRFSR